MQQQQLWGEVVSRWDDWPFEIVLIDIVTDRPMTVDHKLSLSLPNLVQRWRFSAGGMLWCDPPAPEESCRRKHQTTTKWIRTSAVGGRLEIQSRLGTTETVRSNDCREK
mmetsp:Transcript_861/g.2040  ORF Transcript_861/g.2040 Transcript_861/m.2040 type:complete len:109 (-) Transcript_861:3049-3375(-)